MDGRTSGNGEGKIRAGGFAVNGRKSCCGAAPANGLVATRSPRICMMRRRRSRFPRRHCRLRWGAGIRQRWRS